MKTGGLFVLAAAVMATGAASAWAVDGTNVNGVVWAHSYEGDVIPALATPAFNEPSYTTNSTDGALLTISSGYGQMLGGVGSPNWDGTTASGSTIEFSARVVSQGGAYGSLLECGDTNGYFEVRLNNNGVSIFGAGGLSAVYPLDGTIFHLYRLTFSNGVGSVWVDNGDIGGGAPIFTSAEYPYAPGYNNFDFGYGGGWTDSTAQYDFVRWTNQGVFAPVPEPGASVLVCSAGWFLLRRRNRK